MIREMDPEALVSLREGIADNTGINKPIPVPVPLAAELLADRDYQRTEVDRLRARVWPTDEDAERMGVTMDHVRAWLTREGFSRGDDPETADAWIQPKQEGRALRIVIDLNSEFMGTNAPRGCAHMLRRTTDPEDCSGAWRVLEEMATVTDG